MENNNNNSSKVNEIVSLVLSLESLSTFEGNTVIDAMKIVMARKEQAVKATFKVGQNVSWDSKPGEKKTGKITKINKKNIKVLSNTDELWTVSPGLLTVN